MQGCLTMEMHSVFMTCDLVQHKIFRTGRVLKDTNAGKDYKLTINFGGTHRDILSSFVQKA